MEEVYKIYKQSYNTAHGHVIWEVSNLGNVKKNGEPYKIRITNSGYRSLLSNIMVHRAVAELFLEPSDLNCVDHINNNRLDNRAINLRWISYGDNNKKANAHSLGGIAAGKSKNSSSIRITTCPYCNKEGRLMPMKRWHFDNCKHKPNE